MVYVQRSLQAKWLAPFLFLVIFSVLYSISSLLIVPPVAKHFGRVPMPWQGDVRPLNIATCLLNRHYVKPALREAVLASASAVRKKYPGTVTNYLDGCFPFYNGFPLMPHLSHNDGRKLDIAFFYTDVNGVKSDDSPSWIGYGVYEGPREHEENYPLQCKAKGYWQYGILEQVASQRNKNRYKFDAQRTAYLVNVLSKQSAIHKIFIEPHLKTRLALSSPKIRYHGCQAVRHDDHIHVQL